MARKVDHSSRAHAVLSASSSDRWLNCPPSAIAAMLYKAGDTDYTREGTQAHEVAEIITRAALDGTEPEIPNWADAEMIECAGQYRDFILEHRGANAFTLLEQRVDFSPWVPDGFGTADCVIMDGNVLHVIDFKYGKGVAVSCDHNPQEMLYGLGALNDYGIALDAEIVRLTIFQPRMGNISTYDMTVEELLTWAEDVVKPTAGLASVGEGEYQAGAWCKFCPHSGKCRKLTQTCTEIVKTHGVSAKVQKLAPHEVAEVLELEPLVTLWLKRVREQALTDLLNGNDVPGYKAVAGRGSRSWADEIETAAALKAAGYKPEEYTKTELLSVAAMEKALGKKRVAELVGGQIMTTTGAPTVAKSTDKRPVYDRMAEAQNDFKEDNNK